MLDYPSPGLATERVACGQGRRLLTPIRPAVPMRRLAILALLSLAMDQAIASPQFVSVPITTAKAGEPYIYEIVVTGVGNITISAPTGLPPWLTLTPTGNGTASLSGVPGNDDVGTGILLRAEDQDRSCEFFQDIPCVVFQAFDITVTPNFPPTVVPPGIADQIVPEEQSFVLDATASIVDPENDPLTFTATGLPASLSINGSGSITGTPTFADVQGSPFTVTVTATDQQGRQASDTFLLTVVELPGADIGLTMIGARGDSVLVSVVADWVFELTNHGPADSSPLGLSIDFRGNPITLTEHPCQLTVSGNRQSLSCDVAGLAAGTSTSITVRGVTAQPGDVYVVASVAGSAPVPRDPVTQNNRVSRSLSVARSLSTEAAQVLSGPSASAIAGADLNGDGFDDLGVVTVVGSPAAVHLNLENPSTLHPTLRSSGNSRRGLSSVPVVLQDDGAGTGLAFADLDGDGDLDLVTSNGAGFLNAVFLNDGTGVLTELARLGSNEVDTHGVAVGDINGDGLSDLVFANAGPHHVYRNEGAGFALVASIDEPGRDSVALVDVDLDGLLDLVFAGGGGRAVLLRNLGQGSFGNAAVIDPGPTASVASGDFNGDGLADLVFARRTPGATGVPSNAVYLNNGASAFVHVSELGASPTIDVVAADFDDDGLLDVVSINATATHQVFLGDGNGNFRLHPAQFVSADASGGAAGRFGYKSSLGLALSGAAGMNVFLNDGRGEMGLGDLRPPVINLIGVQEVSLPVGAPYEDAGATATDDLDGQLTPAVHNPVDTAVIGEYRVVYTAIDSSGNAATPVMRTVRVGTGEAVGGGGGGAWDLASIVLLLLSITLRRRGTAARREASVSGGAFRLARWHRPPGPR